LSSRYVSAQRTVQDAQEILHDAKTQLQRFAIQRKEDLRIECRHAEQARLHEIGLGKPYR
jgi:hypothetical protein